jgi:hypothetical protein
MASWMRGTLKDLGGVIVILAFLLWTSFTWRVLRVERGILKRTGKFSPSDLPPILVLSAVTLALLGVLSLALAKLLHLSD